MSLRLALVLSFGGFTPFIAEGSAGDRFAPMPREAQNALVNDFCSGCHSEKTKKGDLILEGFDAASPFLGADVLEKVILKLRAGMMPPQGKERPEPGVLETFVQTLEARADASVARSPEPPWRPLQRLNRAEYALAVRDLLGVDITANDFLPQDTTSAGFDNIAEVQTVSPSLITAYLRGAAQVSRLAVGAKGKDTKSRRKIFSCYPKSPKEETSCAAGILSRLTRVAYRGQGTPSDTSAALAFFSQGLERGGNFTAQLLTYATGRRLGPRDMPTVRAIVRAASKEDNRFLAFVMGIVTSDAFRLTQAPKGT